jgi:hypothetical protein
MYFQFLTIADTKPMIVILGLNLGIHHYRIPALDYPIKPGIDVNGRTGLPVQAS